MAKVAVCTAGYRGDVLPFMPVASALAARGHDVTAVIPTEFHELLRHERFRCSWSGPEFGPRELEEFGAVVARSGNRAAGSSVARALLRHTMDRLDETMDGLITELQGFDLVVVHSGGAVTTATACDVLGIPWIVGDTLPLTMPSGYNPVMGLPDLGPTGNRLIWRIASSRMTDYALGVAPLRRYRRDRQLPLRGWSVVNARFSPWLSLGLFSSAYFTPGMDWPDNYHVVGFTPWEGPAAYRLPTEVSRWIQAGEPPFIVTLGSSAASGFAGLFESIASALDRHGQRGLFLVSTEENVSNLTSSISTEHSVWDFLPIEPLLASSTAVIHSGSAGINSQVLRAGLPSIVRPCMGDQKWNGKRQVALGTGLLVQNDSFDAAVQEVISDTKIHRRSEDFGRILRSENGPAEAADHIERLALELLQRE